MSLVSPYAAPKPPTAKPARKTRREVRGPVGGVGESVAGRAVLLRFTLRSLRFFPLPCVNCARPPPRSLSRLHRGSTGASSERARRLRAAPLQPPRAFIPVRFLQMCGSDRCWRHLAESAPEDMCDEDYRACRSKCPLNYRDLSGLYPECTAIVQTPEPRVNVIRDGIAYPKWTEPHSAIAVHPRGSTARTGLSQSLNQFARIVSAGAASFCPVSASARRIFRCAIDRFELKSRGSIQSNPSGS